MIKGLIIFLLLGIHSINAQFSQYKSDTDVDVEEPETDPSKETDPNDIFGRDSGINQVTTVKKDKKYVNLNP